MGKPVIIQSIYELLKKNPDGLTAPEIAKATGFDLSNTSRSMHRVELAYIDRWIPNPASNRWIAVWCLADPPKNAPLPTLSAHEYLCKVASERRSHV